MIEAIKCAFYGWTISELIFIHIFILFTIFKLENILFNIGLLIFIIFGSFFVIDSLKLFENFKLSDFFNKYNVFKKPLYFIFPLIILYSVILFVNYFGMIICITKIVDNENNIGLIIISGLILGLNLNFVKTFLEFKLNKIKNYFVCLLFVSLNNFAYHFEAYWIIYLFICYTILVGIINIILMLNEKIMHKKIK